jgi:hypothetical protein
MFLLVSLALQVDSDSISAAAGSQKQSLSCSSTELNEYDSSLLLYMLPASVTNRANGREVAWELQNSPKLNRRIF